LNNNIQSLQADETGREGNIGTNPKTYMQDMFDSPKKEKSEGFLCSKDKGLKYC
jgi:hypothetical protein